MSGKRNCNTRLIRTWQVAIEARLPVLRKRSTRHRARARRAWPLVVRALPRLRCAWPARSVLGRRDEMLEYGPGRRDWPCPDGPPLSAAKSRSITSSILRRRNGRFSSSAVCSTSRRASVDTTGRKRPWPTISFHWREPYGVTMRVGLTRSGFLNSYGRRKLRRAYLRRRHALLASKSGTFWKYGIRPPSSLCHFGMPLPLGARQRRPWDLFVVWIVPSRGEGRRPVVATARSDYQ